MAYNILGIHPGHNGSAALISDGKLVYYLEEERLSRFKRDGNPFRTMVDIFSKYKINELIIGGTNEPKEHNTLPWTWENTYQSLTRKFNPDVKTTVLNHQHHLLHAACAYFNSGFNKSIVLVIDGAGSLKYHNPDYDNNKEISSFEAESIWVVKDNNEITPIYKSYGGNEYFKSNTTKELIDNAVTITKTYEAVTQFLGWEGIEGGKTMGFHLYLKMEEVVEIFLSLNFLEEL